MNYHRYGRHQLEVRDIKKAASSIFMLGFFTGIIYVNVIAKTYVASMGIFSDYFLEQYSVNHLDTKEYLFYILQIRIIPLLILSIAGCTKYKKTASSIFLLWTGFSGGIIFTAATFKLGIKGIGLCIVSILPHFILYIAAYVILILYLYSYPNIKWNSTKTMSVIIFIMTGIVSECYINPVILEIFIDLF